MDLFESLMDFLFPRRGEEYKVLSMDAGEVMTTAGIMSGMRFEFIRSALMYRNPIASNLVWLIKYKRHAKAIALGAELLFSMIADDVGDSVAFEKLRPLLIPVPLFKRRKHERGFNQTELLAEKIMEIGGTEFLSYKPHLISKVRATAPQTSLNKEKRMRNVEGSFQVTQKESVAGQTIFLVDDVVTTGATLSEIKKILIEAGAKRVSGYTIAH